MARTIGIGIQSFEELRKNDCFYIDKTLFIKEWWESCDSTTLITRPRRFGKTLNMSMLHTFFSVDYAGRGDLFEDLFIWEEEKYQNLQGTYPVISLSFANVKEDNFLSTKNRIYQILVDLYENHTFLKDEGVLKETEVKFFDSVNLDMNEETATLAIHKLCKFLNNYYGKKVIVLLDEYDTPMQEAYVNGYWDELVCFTRSLFNPTFKTNPYMERGIMTGITRVSRESIFSDLNHLEVVTTTSNKYAVSFGFTEEEVFAALDEFGISGEREGIKHWYDGFIFGKYKDIYNPWSILNFLDKKNYIAYWANTSANSFAAKLLREGNYRIKMSFERLLNGEHIYCNIDEQIVYSQLEDSEEAVWSILVASGYLKILSYEREEEIDEDADVMYELALTNYEVRRMFRSMIRGWFKSAKVYYNDFIKAMFMGNIKAMNEYMNRVALQTFSYFDTGKGPMGAEPERFYHGFVLGLLVDLGEKYVITSNRESGFGRYDVMLEPKNKGDNAYILEFKIHDKEDEEDLRETVEAALKQIEEKQYETSLIAKGIPAERIYKYGFAFEGKKVLIG